MDARRCRVKRAIPRSFVSPARIDPAAIEAAARQPNPWHPEVRDFRFPDPGDYPLKHRPWIKSREDLIADMAWGEDPAVVRSYSAGPEEELIDYLGEVFNRAGSPASRPISPAPGGRLVGRTRKAEAPNSPGRAPTPPT